MRSSLPPLALSLLIGFRVHWQRERPGAKKLFQLRGAEHLAVLFGQEARECVRVLLPPGGEQAEQRPQPEPQTPRLDALARGPERLPARLRKLAPEPVIDREIEGASPERAIL